MSTEFRFAQKGLILDSTKTKILVHRYKDAKYNSAKLTNKLGLPGGRMEFGEIPDESFIREVEEETGVSIIPAAPFYLWTWRYKKEDREVQIVAAARIGLYQSGDISAAREEEESDIQKTFWLSIDEIVLDEFVVDEQPVITKFLEYREKNPFSL